MKITCYILLILCSVAFQSPISTPLFNIDLAGEPFSVNFLSEREILTSSTRGLISKIDLNSGDVIYRKNLVYPMRLSMQSEEKCN